MGRKINLYEKVSLLIKNKPFKIINVKKDENNIKKSIITVKCNLCSSVSQKTYETIRRYGITCRNCTFSKKSKGFENLNKILEFDPEIEIVDDLSKIDKLTQNTKLKFKCKRCNNIFEKNLRLRFTKFGIFCPQCISKKRKEFAKNINKPKPLREKIETLDKNIKVIEIDEINNMFKYKCKICGFEGVRKIPKKLEKRNDYIYRFCEKCKLTEKRDKVTYEKLIEKINTTDPYIEPLFSKSEYKGLSGYNKYKCLRCENIFSKSNRLVYNSSSIICDNCANEFKNVEQCKQFLPNHIKILEIVNENLVKVICEKCKNIELRSPYPALNKEVELGIILCSNCDTYNNHLEKTVENILKDLGVNFIKNDREFLNGYELDFFIPSKSVAIEVKW